MTSPSSLIPAQLVAGCRCILYVLCTCQPHPIAPFGLLHAPWCPHTAHHPPCLQPSARSTHGGINSAGTHVGGFHKGGPACRARRQTYRAPEAAQAEAPRPETAAVPHQRPALRAAMLPGTKAPAKAFTDEDAEGLEDDLLIVDEAEEGSGQPGVETQVLSLLGQVHLSGSPQP